MEDGQDEQKEASAAGATQRPFRVLSLDGGGMRGTYTATYLDRVSTAFARKRKVERLDVGAAFDLIVGTSTGGIIACALAAGAPLSKVVDLYRKHGPAIFERRLPAGLVALTDDLKRRPAALRRGEAALRKALVDVLGDRTLGDIFESRRIALAITAVEMSQHRSWVFKTPHLTASTSHRDDGYRLADVCLATSAAPIYRSLAVLQHTDGGDGFKVFADGGLWANNPVLVGFIDALEMTEPGRAIEIFCLGTCPRPAGEQLTPADAHRGLGQWQFGGAAASLSIDAQEFAYDNMARMLARHTGRPCRIIRFPREQTPAALMPYLDLDDTRDAAALALINQARTDADMTNSRCGRPDDADGQLICQLFTDAPAAEAAPQEIA